MSDFIISAHVGTSVPIYLKRMEEATGKINLQESFRLRGTFERIDDALDVIGLKPLRCWSLFEGHALLEYDNYNFVELSGGKRRGGMRAEVYGDRPFRDRIRELREVAYVPRIEWTFTNHKGEHATALLELGDVDPVHDAYYPFLKGGVKGFLDSYLNSKSAILVMAGEPGTGKTSLIRHMIKAYERKTIVTHDEAVMGSDMFYVDYMMNDERDLMVIEDADLLLTSRTSEGNRTMAKLLNASDGLVRLLQKKIIFTTNVANLREIDPALIRPGRCYGVVHFRSLMSEEAKAAADAAAIELPPGSGDRTLSEIFNGKARVGNGAAVNGLRMHPVSF